MSSDTPVVPYTPKSRGPVIATGKRPRDARMERILASPNQQDGRFQNPIPTRLSEKGAAPGIAWQWVSGGEERSPKEPVPAEQIDPSIFAAHPQDGLRMTWIGHSSMLIEIDGHRVLTDPVWSKRIGPVKGVGPRRFLAPPIRKRDLPPLDAVLVSHDHYDHLDAPTVAKLAERGVPFVTALGVGAHLEAWGIDPEQIIELDWWESCRIGGLEFTAAPCRHFSGRSVVARRTLWASWAIKGPTRSVWFSGDTGPWDGFADIGARLGPFDVSMVEIGAWHPGWGQVHLGPDNALKVHQQIGAKTMLPVHWGTFNLALHAWDAPIIRLLEIAAAAGVHLAAPVIGRSIIPERATIADVWQQRMDVQG